MRSNVISRVLVLSAIGIGFAASSSSTYGAPGRDIRRGPGGPVLPGIDPFTGPAFDPTAAGGQWFRNLATGGVDVRTHEFYDNIATDSGGAAGFSAITGRVTALTLAPGGGAITAFDITAIVANDLPGGPGGAPGVNSHGERHLGPNDPNRDMKAVKLTAEFALPLPPVAAPFGVGPYLTPPGAPITAVNYDQLAWYCWTPGLPHADPPGDFHVPTWDFGDIPNGASATRVMSFTSPGISTADPNFGPLFTSFQNGVDIFMNRTSDLKIGDWVDSLAVDTGVAYPIPALRSGDVSVFYNVPEPAALTCLLGIGSTLLVRRARR